MVLKKSVRHERLSMIEAGGRGEFSSFARDVHEGLTRQEKRLSCRYFYDEEGSRLFEEICQLEEYYVPRAEREILERNAEEIVWRLPAAASLVELGSGNAAKTRILIRALIHRNGSLRYGPIDVSRTMLEESSIGLLEDHPTLDVLAVSGEYDGGLRAIAPHFDGPTLILWLGSNIGNFDRVGAAAFLGRVAAQMVTGDRLLVGIDLRKDRRTLERAYDDSQGVTARFNKNILARINRDLGGEFDLDSFRHRAVYREDAGRIEMFLVSQRAQRVRISEIGLSVDFRRGEAVHTEDSYKYSESEIEILAESAGLRLERQWSDGQGLFSENLMVLRGDERRLRLC